MNRTTGFLTALCLFGLSAGLAWLVSAPAASGARHSRIPGPAPAGPSVVITPESLLGKYERQLTGDAAHSGPWSGEQFDRMMRAFWDTGEEQRDLREYAEGWMRHDPAAAIAWLQSHGSIPGVGGGDTTYLKVSVLFHAWAKVDVESALAAVPRLTRPDIRGQALFSVWQVLWRTDPVRARGIWAQNQDVFDEKEWYQWSRDDGGAAKEDLAFLKSLPPGTVRSRLLVQVMEDIAETDDVAPAVSFWDAAPIELRRDLVTLGLLRRSGEAPYLRIPDCIPSFMGMEDLMRAWAESSGKPADLKAFYYTCGAAWAARDLPAALAWVGDHFTGREGTDTSVRLFETAAEKDFDTAVRTWQAQPEGSFKAQAAGALVRGAPEDRQPEARALLETLSKHDQQKALEISGPLPDLEATSPATGGE